MALTELIKEMERQISERESPDREVEAHAEDREDPVGADEGVP